MNEMENSFSFILSIFKIENFEIEYFSIVNIYLSKIYPI